MAVSAPVGLPVTKIAHLWVLVPWQPVAVGAGLPSSQCVCPHCPKQLSAGRGVVAAALPAVRKAGRGCGAQSVKPPSKVGRAFALALNTRAWPGEAACPGAGVTRLAGREVGSRDREVGSRERCFSASARQHPTPPVTETAAHPC